MHKNILTKKQIELLPLVRQFNKKFGLVGGTAIALQIGHRRSVDFDLFTNKDFDNEEVEKIVKNNGWKINKVDKNEIGEYTFFVNNVRLTFLKYPFKIKFLENFDQIIKMPNLLTLASMKAYALGRRAKWKDYVDLYFIIEKYHSIKKITSQCKKIFKGEFNEKTFREQLTYFDDVNYSEKVVFLPNYKISDKKIRETLVKSSIE